MRSCATRFQLLYLLICCAWFCQPPARAVLFYATGDPAYNSTAPAGSLTNSGWQWQGLLENSYKKYLGTAIAPNYFLTAQHLAVDTNWTFRYEDQTFSVVAVTNDPLSDLTVCRVNGALASYAPLYTSSDEAGQAGVVFGRGTDRGAAVTNLDLHLSGWKWGAYNYTQRWGVNTVTETGVADGNPYLAAAFDADGSTNECMLSDKDSGGGFFLQDGGLWKLAGINWAVDPVQFNTVASDAGSYYAALFDYGGLYYKTASGWQFATNTTQDLPQNFYVTRVSERADWVMSVIPEPSGVLVVGLATLFVLHRFRRWSR